MLPLSRTEVQPCKPTSSTSASGRLLKSRETCHSEGRRHFLGSQKTFSASKMRGLDELMIFKIKICLYDLFVGLIHKVLRQVLNVDLAFA